MACPSIMGYINIGQFNDPMNMIWHFRFQKIVAVSDYLSAEAAAQAKNPRPAFAGYESNEYFG
jgi:hypothetical protein